jgi:hypothetical protein
MPIKDVVSPVTRPGSKVGSNQPMSPGAKSNPSRPDALRPDSVPPQPQHHARSTHSEEGQGAQTTVVGPEGPED